MKKKPNRVTSRDGAREPRQERSRRTLDRFLETAVELLADRRFEDASVQEIARRAGSSVGAFYTRFPNKDALLHQINELVFSRAKEQWGELLDPKRWEGVPLSRILEHLITLLVEKRKQNRGFLRAISLYARSNPEAGFAARAAQMNRYVYDRLRILLSRTGEIRHPQPELAIAFGFFLIDAVTREAILFADTGLPPERFSKDTLIGELSRTLDAYLGIPETKGSRR